MTPHDLARSSARLGSRSGSARGSAHWNSEFRSPLLSLARLDSARLGSARLDSAWLGLARLGSAWLGSARLSSARLATRGSAHLGSCLRLNVGLRIWARESTRCLARGKSPGYQAEQNRVVSEMSQAEPRDKPRRADRAELHARQRDTSQPRASSQA